MSLDAEQEKDRAFKEGLPIAPWHEDIRPEDGQWGDFGAFERWLGARMEEACTGGCVRETKHLCGPCRLYQMWEDAEAYERGTLYQAFWAAMESAARNTRTPEAGDRALGHGEGG